MSRHSASPRELPRLLSIRAAAQITTIPATTLYTLVSRGELPAVRIGRAVRIDERDLLAFIEAHRERGAA
jgi:excisionase family DNA binding protein